MNFHTFPVKIWLNKNKINNIKIFIFFLNGLQSEHLNELKLHIHKVLACYANFVFPQHSSCKVYKVIV